MYFVSEILLWEDGPLWVKLGWLPYDHQANQPDTERIIESFVLEGTLKIISPTMDRGIFH